MKHSPSSIHTYWSSQYQYHQRMIPFSSSKFHKIQHLPNLKVFTLNYNLHTKHIYDIEKKTSKDRQYSKMKQKSVKVHQHMSDLLYIISSLYQELHTTPIHFYKKHLTKKTPYMIGNIPN